MMDNEVPTAQWQTTPTMGVGIAISVQLNVV